MNIDRFLEAKNQLEKIEKLRAQCNSLTSDMQNIQLKGPGIEFHQLGVSFRRDEVLQLFKLGLEIKQKALSEAEKVFKLI